MKSLLFGIGAAGLSAAVALLSVPRKAEATPIPPALGSYSVSFSGGSTSSSGGTAHTAGPTQTGNTYSYGITCQPSTGNTAKGNCSGTITATFTWVPGTEETDPPSVVVIKKYSKAQWSGNGASTDDDDYTRGRILKYNFWKRRRD